MCERYVCPSDELLSAIDDLADLVRAFAKLGKAFVLMKRGRLDEAEKIFDELAKYRSLSEEKLDLLTDTEYP